MPAIAAFPSSTKDEIVESARASGGWRVVNVCSNSMCSGLSTKGMLRGEWSKRFVICEKRSTGRGIAHIERERSDGRYVITASIREKPVAC